jgi:dihydroorotate dehydrogenase (NAD+) catalytic subunit
MLNSIGLQNIGLDALINEKAPVWAGWQVPVVVNIAGRTIDDYAELARKLDKVLGIAGLEVNISCPNVKAGGAEFGANAESAAKVTEAVRKATTLPVIVKLTPNTAEIVHIAQAVVAAGADALCLINTVKGMAINIKTRKPMLGNGYGGLSGPAIKPMALYMVYEVFKSVNIPIIGCGGITNANDAIEFFMAGATAIQVGTASFMNPRAPMDVLEGIGSYLEKEKIQDIRELIGAAHN